MDKLVATFTADVNRDNEVVTQAASSIDDKLSVVTQLVIVGEGSPNPSQSPSPSNSTSPSVSTPTESPTGSSPSVQSLLFTGKPCKTIVRCWEFYWTEEGHSFFAKPREITTFC